MLSLARVLVEKPRLLIADELSLGLAPIVVDEVYRTLETIRDAGTTLLIVEQHVHHALAIADDAIVLVKGEVAYSRAGVASSATCRRASSAAKPRRQRRLTSGYVPNSARVGDARRACRRSASRSTRTWPASA